MSDSVINILHATSRSRILTCALLLAIGLATGGCETTSAPPSERPAHIPVPSDDPAALLSRAAEAPPAVAAQLRLAAAWLYFDAGDLEGAGTAFAAVDKAALSRGDRPRYQLLGGELALARGDTDAADRWLGDLDLGEHDVTNRRSLTCAARGDYVCAANELIRAADGQTRDNNLIWRYLGLAPGLDVAEQSATTSGLTRGWWQLKHAMLTSYSPADRRRAVDFWRQSWPDHPASRALPNDLATSIASTWAPQHIGLLLPLSGPLAAAGQAVRDGFVAAYLEEPREDLRVSFFDTESAPLAQLYEQLLLADVDLVVGPLRKERVVELNALNPELPVVGLNYLEPTDTPAPQLLQLGLAIEDEAVTIARALDHTRAENLLVVHNYEDWSLRARRQLEESWTGTMTVQAFTDIRTVTEAVGTAMNVKESRERKDALAKLLGEDLEFLPRARQDFDAVVALVDNVEANALVPALRFHFADHLPVYACSQVVRGARRSQLVELNGFQVSELPWYVSGDKLYQAMLGPFKLVGDRFSSLDALGADALRIALLLGSLPRNDTTVVQGSTGVLTLTSNGRFRRELSWAVIRNGVLTGEEPPGAAD